MSVKVELSRIESSQVIEVLKDLPKEKWDQYQYLGNCPPTPPLTQHSTLTCYQLTVVELNKERKPEQKTQHNEEQKNNSSKGKEKVITPCFASSFDLFINVTKQREQGKVRETLNAADIKKKKKTNAEKRSHFPFDKLLIK